MAEKTLLDLGERQIVREIIPRFTSGTGDDCAIVELAGLTVVVTTDPVPPPAAASPLIGKDTDPFWIGWLLVTINASDLAASGAKPLAFLAAIDCQNSLLVGEFERLLEGVQAACKEAGLRYAGGNLREAAQFSAVGTALGFCQGYQPLARTGAYSGDVVVSIGQGGIFWRDAITRLIAGEPVDKSVSPVFSPRSQIDIMWKLATAGLVRAAMDNSDGLLPSLAELCEKNDLGIDLELERLEVPNVQSGIDPARLWLGWGDWNVIAGISRENLAEAQNLAKDNGETLVEIGTFVASHNSVWLHRGGHSMLAPRLESERFARNSWMLGGLNAYIKLLQEVELP